MNKEVLYCHKCGRLLRIRNKVYCPYKIRWSEKARIALCSNCFRKMPAETEYDIPSFRRKL